MPEPCDFPTCKSGTPAVRRADGAHTCPTHEHVRVAGDGSWMDNHSREDD